VGAAPTRAFRGVIRAADGTIDGVGSKWRRGYDRWVRDVLVWTRVPFLFRNELLPVDDLNGQRPARPDEVKRLGDHPVILRVRTGDATAEIAVRSQDMQLVLDGTPLAVPAAAEPPAAAAAAAPIGGKRT
jgi:hypothetical protein